jgi:hypothetical protein
MTPIEHIVCDKIKKYFNIDLSYELYLKLNKNAQYAHMIKSTPSPHQDFRKMKFMSYHIDIIFDRILNIVVDVSPSNNDYKIIKSGNIISCRVVDYSSEYGYTCQLMNYKNLIRVPLHKEQPIYTIGKRLNNLVVVNTYLNKHGIFNIIAQEGWYLKTIISKFDGRVRDSIDKIKLSKKRLKSQSISSDVVDI